MGAIPGAVTVQLAMHTIGSMSVPGTLLYVGVKGRRTGYFAGFLGYHSATVDDYAWTLHTQTFTGLTSRGMALPDVVAKGTFGLSPVNPVHDVFGGAGTVTLVAPTRIAVTGPIPRRTVSLTTLKLHFVSDGPYDTIPVPEASVLRLLAAGGLAFGFARRRC
jgi:hypothetical protein